MFSENDLLNKERWLSQLIESKEITSPALAIDASVVKSTLNLFEKYIPEAKIYYAIKANNTPSLLQYLANQGVSFDVASTQEILDLKALGISSTRMILSNPIKSPRAINTFFENKLKLLVVDNIDDIQNLSRAHKQIAADHPVGILVRIRIASAEVQIDLNSKFGCLEEEALPLIKAAAEAGFQPRGIQFHVGTQSWSTHNYTVGVETALRIIDKAKSEIGIRLDTLNIGGGYPDPSMANKAGGLDSFFTGLAAAIAPAIARGLNIIAEPGRIIASAACSSVSSVIGKSIRNGTPWLYLDDGAYGLYSGKFFDLKEFNLRVLKQKNTTGDNQLVRHVVAGPTCDSIDVISENALLPANLEIGDILCAHNMGAYSIVTASNFNGFGHIDTYLGNSMEAEFSQFRKLRAA